MFYNIVNYKPLNCATFCLFKLQLLTNRCGISRITHNQAMLLHESSVKGVGRPHLAGALCGISALPSNQHCFHMTTGFFGVLLLIFGITTNPYNTLHSETIIDVILVSESTFEGKFYSCIYTKRIGLHTIKSLLLNV